MNIFQQIKKTLSSTSNSVRSLFKSNTWSGPDLSQKDNLDIYKLSLYLNKAIEKRARSVSKVQWKLFKQNGDELGNDNKWIRLLNRPNNILAGTEFWRLYQVYRDLNGEAFIYIEKSGNEVDALHLIPPSRIKIEWSQDGSGEVEEYKVEQPKGGSETYDPDQIIRNYTPDPKNNLKAISLIEAGKKSLHTEVQLRDYQEHILQNGGKVEGIFNFKTESGLSKEQINTLKKQYKDQYAGSKNAGTPLFLGGDAKYQKLGLDPKELSYLDSLGFTLEDICILTEVPKPILSSFSGVKYKNAEEAKKIFLQETIKPLLDDLVNNLNEFLIPEELTLGYESVVPKDKEETRKDLETGNNINALTINEKREALGKEPIDDGDKILVPMNVVPMDTASEQPEGDKK